MNLHKDFKLSLKVYRFDFLLKRDLGLRDKFGSSGKAAQATGNTYLIFNYYYYFRRDLLTPPKYIFPSHTNLLNRFFVRVEAQQNQNDELLGRMEKCGFVGAREGGKI